jgi:PqqD family protein of HPr-rel-A system
MIDTDAGKRWRLYPLAEFHWRTWDDASVVLEARSGQIHACDPLAAAVMACLEEAPASIGDIAAMLANDLQVPSDAEFESTIAEIVHHFQIDGWVEPIMRP